MELKKDVRSANCPCSRVSANRKEGTSPCDPRGIRTSRRIRDREGRRPLPACPRMSCAGTDAFLGEHQICAMANGVSPTPSAAPRSSTPTVTASFDLLEGGLKFRALKENWATCALPPSSPRTSSAGSRAQVTGTAEVVDPMSEKRFRAPQRKRSSPGSDAREDAHQVAPD